MTSEISDKMDFSPLSSLQQRIAPTDGSACHVTPLPGEGDATHTGGCSAGTRAGDLGGCGYHAGVGRRAVSRRYLGKTGAPYTGSACHVTPLPGTLPPHPKSLDDSCGLSYNVIA
ncbi:MAG: hypothetical protein KGZ50_02565 [Peptococcaceae bacterium]|nr:hypothetical protein [Peptococcaceae bacterium]